MTASTHPVRRAAAVVGLVLLAGVFSGLGFWQVRRAAESRALEERFAATDDAPALLEPPAQLSNELRFRRLGVRGSYSGERQVLLDNRVHDGVAGYEVLTPFRLADEPRWLLVNRGWVPAALDRSELPDVAIDAAPRAVVGRIERLPRAGLRLGAPAAAPAPGPVAVLLYPTAAELGAVLGEPVPDYQLLLDADAPDGFLRDWRAPGLGPSRHIAYAGQWFVFGLVALGAAAALVLRGRAEAEPPT